MSEPNNTQTDDENEVRQDESQADETPREEAVDGFPDANEITTLLGDDFEMPSFTTENDESAPSAEPEPVTDPETGESYFDEESQNFQRPEGTTGEKDAKGRVFDPQLHAADENGCPRYNKKGFFIFLRKDKRGKVDTDAPRKAEFYESGLMYFDGATETLAALLGDHWKPENEDQRKMMGRTVGRYLESTDAKPLTPRDDLLLKSAIYSAPRATHTDTIDNAKLIISKTVLGVKSFWQTLTGKKKPKREAPAEVPQAEEVIEDDNGTSDNK